MKNFFLIIFFISLIFPFAPVSAEDAAWRLPERELIVFKVKWLGITAGQIVTEIKGIVNWKGRRAYKIEVTARTVGFCSTLYRVEDHYVSYLDVERLHSLRHEVHRREGGYKKDAVIDFDQDAHMAYFKSATDGSEKAFSIPPDTQDTVTASYVARTRPLMTGGSHTFNICNSERNYTVDLAVTGQRRMRVHGLGVIDVLRIYPTGKVDGGQFRAGRMSGYVSAAPGHLPALIVIKAPVFTQVTATLSEHSF